MYPLRLKVLNHFHQEFIVWQTVLSWIVQMLVLQRWSLGRADGSGWGGLRVWVRLRIQTDDAYAGSVNTATTPGLVGMLARASLERYLRPRNPSVAVEHIFIFDCVRGADSGGNLERRGYKQAPCRCHKQPRSYSCLEKTRRECLILCIRSLLFWDEAFIFDCVRGTSCLRNRHKNRTPCRCCPHTPPKMAHIIEIVGVTSYEYEKKS